MSDRVVAGRYLLEEAIGRGGMGTVWRAEDRLLQRPVALKQVEIPRTVPVEERDAMRKRVFREARAAARLNHPGAVTVFDVAEDDGKLFIAMELAEGTTLSKLVDDNGPLPPPRVARIGLRLLEALEAAHAKGIVHRDVKPGNVIVTADGRVMLADFGIASVKGDPRLTATGLVLGSPSYMSPEQARGEEAGPASDLWALGATLYFAVEGKVPFDRGGALQTLVAVLHEEPPPLERAGPLAEGIRSLLSKDPARRPKPDTLRPMLERVGRVAETGTYPGTPPILPDVPDPSPTARWTPADEISGEIPGPDAGGEAPASVTQATQEVSQAVPEPTTGEEPATVLPEGPSGAEAEAEIPEPATPAPERSAEPIQRRPQEGPAAPPAPSPAASQALASSDAETGAAAGEGAGAGTGPGETGAGTGEGDQAGAGVGAGAAAASAAAGTAPAAPPPASKGPTAPAREGAPAPPAAEARPSPQVGPSVPPSTGAPEQPASSGPTAPPPPARDEPSRQAASAAAFPPPAASTPPGPVPPIAPPPRTSSARPEASGSAPPTAPPSPAPRAPAESPERPPSKGPGRLSPAAIATLAVAALACIALLVWLRPSRNTSPDVTAPSAPAPSATGTQGAPSPASSQPAPSRAPSTQNPGGAAVPAGWQPYRIAGTGYEIAHPADWTVIENPIKDGSSVRFQDGSGRYLLVDWTDSPGTDAAAAWRDLAAGFARSHKNYQQIRIEPTTFRNFRTAAIWEFRYRVGNTDLHAVDFGFADDKHGFALNFQTPEQDWASSQGLFQSFEQAFQAEG